MPAGRPAGAKTAAKKTPEKLKYTCHCCLQEKPEVDFYKSLYTRVWNETGKRVLFCKSCMDNLMNEYSARYGERTALIICCALLDVPFNASAYQGVIENNSIFSIGLYTRLLNGGQYKGKTFLNTLVDGELDKSEETVKEEKEAKWTAKDKQNKKFVIEMLGYDPFDGEGLTDFDRKHCFNILASYLDTDEIKDDGYKVQSVIRLTHLQLQSEKIDQMINTELLQSNPDEKSISNLYSAKKTALESSSKLAQESGIVSSSNTSSKKNSNTLSSKMKEMFSNGYEAIQVNLFDINTSAAIKQIADLSNQSIMEQLTWDANDYTEMIKEQREMLAVSEEKRLSAEEENRLLKNKLALFEKR